MFKFSSSIKSFINSDVKKVFPAPSSPFKHKTPLVASLGKISFAKFLTPVLEKINSCFITL